MSIEMDLPKKRGRPKLTPGQWEAERERGRLKKQAALMAPDAYPNRCWGLNRGGHLERCVCNKGHYRGRDDLHPSPHRDEDGKEWF